MAAYNFREELDQLILEISIRNSQANASLAAVQPVLSFVNSTTASRTEGQSGQPSIGDIDMGDFRYGVQNSTALTASWRLFDGGRARAEYRRSKQAADEGANFATQRDQIRFGVGKVLSSSAQPFRTSKPMPARCCPRGNPSAWRICGCRRV